MKFPLTEKDIYQLVLDESNLNAIYLGYNELFSDQFESIEFYGRNQGDDSYYMRRKLFYGKDGLIGKSESYSISGEKVDELLFSRENHVVKSERISELGLPVYNFWEFNQLGYLVKVYGEYSPYLLEYDQSGQLRKTSEGIGFKWKNGTIHEMINTQNNKVIQRVVSRTSNETKVEFVGRVNENSKGVKTYKYDEIGRLKRIELGYPDSFTEYSYEQEGTVKRESSVSYIGGKQRSLTIVTEYQVNNKRIKYFYEFQQNEGSPKMETQIIKNKI